MIELVQTPRFKRNFKAFVKCNAKLEQSVSETLEAMKSDPFAPFLFTHKLSGKYVGMLACSCGYDCRIAFKIEKHSPGTQLILLTDIGTHDDIY
ncbi:MAG: type II toxin-antitoxin system YafQ family toxin [Candidatus Kapaibacterium sp.]